MNLFEIITCKICLIRFNTNDRYPLCAPCGHTYCQSCLCKTVNCEIYTSPHKKLIICPYDNTEIYYNQVYKNNIIVEIINQTTNGAPMESYKKPQLNSRRLMDVNSKATIDKNRSKSITASNYNTQTNRKETLEYNSNSNNRFSNVMNSSSNLFVDKVKDNYLTNTRRIDKSSSQKGIISLNKHYNHFVNSPVKLTENYKSKEKSKDSIETITYIEEKSIIDQSFKEDCKNLFINEKDRKELDINSIKSNLLIDFQNKFNLTSKNKEYLNKMFSSSIFINLIANRVIPILEILRPNEIFIGSTSNRIRKGCIINIVNEDYYEGDIDENNNKINFGKLIYGNNIVYEGNFLNNKQHGNGKIIQPEGEIYIGEWKDGKINGHGVRYHYNGDKYDGNYVNNIRTGYGNYLFSNGDKYEGNWEMGKASGIGKFTYTNGNIYEGEFKNNQITGKGHFKLSNGEVFKGEFVNGLIQGKGNWSSSSGDSFNGEFLNGKKHGYGVYYNASSDSTYSGIWQNNKYIG